MSCILSLLRDTLRFSGLILVLANSILRHPRLLFDSVTP